MRLRSRLALLLVAGSASVALGAEAQEAPTPAPLETPAPQAETPQTAAPEAPATEAPSTAEAVADALLLPRIAEAMAQEGTAYAEELAATLFGDGPPPASWTASVERIYDPARLRSAITGRLAAELEGADLDAILAFYRSEPGRTFAELEVAAREAMIDEDVEQAAKEAAAVAMVEDGPRLALLRRYAEATDLVDTNVAGALNASYAYYTGLLDGGAIDGGVGAEEILLDVMASEPRVRADTTEWIYSFLLMAYGPASDADVEALIAFAETEPGRQLNAALVTTFDALFEEVSHELGLAAARMLTTQDI